MVTNEQKESVSIYNTEAKVFLDYGLPFLREILSLVRNGEDSFTTKTLREYEDILIEARRLDKDRLQREAIERQRLIDEQTEYRSE